MRVAILGNAGSGKSTLARRLAGDLELPLHEVERFLWRPGWQPAPDEEYAAEHERIVAQSSWLIEGLGDLASIAGRLERATHIVLVDMPLWQYYWLATERQIAWARGELSDRPAGLAEMPPTETLFRTIWQIDRDSKPQVRALVVAAEGAGKRVERIADVGRLSRFELTKATKVGPPE